MDTEENQKRVFLGAHSPWKSQKARFPHSHRPDDEARGKVEIQRQDFHFPTGPIPPLLKPKTKPKKGGLEAGRFAPRLQAHSSMRIWCTSPRLCVNAAKQGGIHHVTLQNVMNFGEGLRPNGVAGYRAIFPMTKQFSRR